MQCAPPFHDEAHCFRSCIEPDADQIARLSRYFLQSPCLGDGVEFGNPDVPPFSFRVDGNKVWAGAIRV